MVYVERDPRAVGVLGVRVAALPNSAMHPSIRRVYDFQQVIADGTRRPPVAIWDAGDILFRTVSKALEPGPGLSWMNS